MINVFYFLRISKFYFDKEHVLIELPEIVHKSRKKKAFVFAIFHQRGGSALLRAGGVKKESQEFLIGEVWARGSWRTEGGREISSSLMDAQAFILFTAPRLGYVQGILEHLSASVQVLILFNDNQTFTL